MKAIRSRRALPLVAAFDLLTCLLLVFVISVGKPKAAPPRIETFGQYAVVIDWAKDQKDDVDLYVRDPQGNIVYYSAPSAGLMNLEHDDIPKSTEVQGATRVAGDNHERAVLRGTVPGEYIVNVHMFRRWSRGTTLVVVRLWRLKGADVVIHEQTVSLGITGDEQTAFRFTINTAGSVISYNRLPRKFVGDATVPNPYGSSGGYPGYRGYG